MSSLSVYIISRLEFSTFLPILILFEGVVCVLVHKFFFANDFEDVQMNDKNISSSFSFGRRTSFLAMITSSLRTARKEDDLDDEL